MSVTPFRSSAARRNTHNMADTPDLFDSVGRQRDGGEGQAGAPASALDYETHPFATAEEAWFWFIQAQAAKNDGARLSGRALLPRPCEPTDILNILDRLYRNRRLIRDHLLVMRHYGRRMLPPDSDRPKEKRAAHLWDEAMDILEESLFRRGFLAVSNTTPRAAE